MTKEIRRYKVDTFDDLGAANFVRVDLPKGAKIIGVSHTWPHDGGKIQIHAIVNPEHKLKERWLAIYCEEVPMEDYEKKTFEYIGMVNGPRLYHVFEVHD
jgi:hypothetical protein